MYRRVRHPMYVAHILAYLGYALSFPSARNLTIVVGMLVAVVLRAGYEENLLARDPDYLDYMRRVPWRFVPGLY
jgi:protein-S-isoprenylcysteine O-methyltransferase Ste14